MGAHRLARAVVVIALALAIPKAAAQDDQRVQTDPIRCWWKTDASAVGVGERFALILTCAVIETASATVVPAVNQLDPGALSVAPFEIVGGRRLDDVVAAPWRYVQFEYDVRLLNEGFFGQDVAIPAVTVTYNVQGPGGASQGRDRGYVLPALPMRVLSLVPRTATDIRDASADTFAAAESRRFRSSVALVLGTVAFAFAGLFVVLAAVSATRRLRPKAAVTRPVPASSLLRGCLDALTEVRAEARGGWTPALVRRALAAMRIAAAVAVGRHVSQDFVAADTAEREGQIAIRTGLVRRRRAVVSAPITARALAEQLANGHRPGSRVHASLEQLGGAMNLFSAVRYGRNGHVDAEALNTALEEGATAVRRLRVQTLWPARRASKAPPATAP